MNTKIGIYSWVIDRNKTGIGIYTYELVKQLLKFKDNIYLIHYFKYNDKIYHGSNEIIIKTYSKIHKIIYFFEPFIIKKYELSLIHFPTHWYNQIPHYLFGKYKKILTVHDLTPILFPFTHTFYDSYLWKSSFKFIKNKADKIIAVSYATKNDLIKYGKIKKEKIKVIYNGYDNTVFKPMNFSLEEIKKFREKYHLPENFILYVGTLEKRKNIENLIRALNVLKKKKKKYSLVILGKKGWKYENIFNLIKKYNLHEQIIFMGYVPQHDLPIFYNLAKVFVYPSLYEGFGLPPLEAMACGCPVITSNVSSIPEIVGDAGILIDPYNYIELAKRIEEVMENASLRKELIQKGLKRAKRFSWEKCAKETYEVYEEVLG